MAGAPPCWALYCQLVASFVISLHLFPSANVYGLCYDVTPLAKGHFACRFAKLLTLARKLQQQWTQPNINSADHWCAGLRTATRLASSLFVYERGFARHLGSAQSLQILPFSWLNGRSATLFGPFHCAQNLVNDFGMLALAYIVHLCGLSCNVVAANGNHGTRYYSARLCSREKSEREIVW